MDTNDASFVPRTVGVEEEYLLVNPRNGRPLAVAESMLVAGQSTALEGAGDGGVCPYGTSLEREAKQEQIEAVSPPCTTLDEVARALITGRRIADESARSVGARAVALGTSVIPVSSRVAHVARYDAMLRQYGLTMTEQLTCGFHVHVGIQGEDEGVAVLDRIRPWLAILLALSSNSPMWMGQDSAYSSYRYQAWGRWPSAGCYEIFGSPDNYRRSIAAMVATGALLDEGMIYFDARLCNHYPTIEIRVADVCMEVDDAVAIAALIRALVETASQEWRAGIAPQPIPVSQLRLAMWSASRYSVDDQLVHPILARQCAARVAVDALLTHVKPALVHNGDYIRTENIIDRIFASGTGAHRQRRMLWQTGNARFVVMDAIERTHLAEAAVLA
ncbi:MAG: YbdK family carboxylate-amine ligase [Homoserinimonas sp.]|nr:YbdK family carboxylate-amine ligase [Homoserinimonas sp.]